MRPIIVDTNAYVAYKRGDKSIIEIFQNVQEIMLTSIVLGELLAGFSCGKREGKNRDDLQKFLASTRISVLPVTFDTTNFFAQIYASLKKKGHPIPTNDMWIAALACEHGCVVCTFDKHFQAIDGLISGNRLSALII